MEQLKVGIIGVGGIARDRHIPALVSLGDKVALTAASDVNEERAEEVARQYGIPHVSARYQDIFKYVDSVIICTPNKFHAEITIAALEAGLHVFCEKPMAMNVAETKEMIATSHKNGKRLGIGYHYRYTDAARLAKQSVLNGDVGDALVTRIQALRRRKVPGWGVFTNKALQGGGSLIDYGCHLIDMAFWLLDDPEPLEVLGRTYNRLSKLPDQINEWGTFNASEFDVDDHVSGYITFRDGSSLLLECSWAANIKEDTMSLSISGVDGGLNVYPYELYKPRHGSFMVSHAEAAHDEHVAGFRQMENFVNSCLGKATLVVKPEQALQVNRIIEAIYKSCETGRSVRLDRCEE